MFPPEELATTWEIAERFGTTAKVVNDWRRAKRNPFPEPVVELGQGGKTRLWWWPEVEEWGIMNDLLPDPGRRWSQPPAVWDDLLTGKDVAELVGWASGSTAWSLSQRGRFPLPIVDRPRGRLWSRGDVEEWMRTAPRKRRRG